MDHSPMLSLHSFISRRTWFRLAAAALLVGVVCTGCGGRDERVFTVRGVVRSPYAEGAITIQHEEIPGFMPAMTMPFFAAEADVRDLVPGDRVEFEFRVGEQSRARKFKKLGREAVANAYDSRDASRGGATIRRLREGDPVPAFSLIDHAERPLTEADLQRGHTVMSFVFTRCPVPEFCPLIGKKLQSVQRQLAGLGTAGEGVRLLTVTIDPEYDRPAVLKAYGESLGADFKRWRFATGSPDEVARLARLFAVRVERNGGSIDHTLATALIGPDGKVVEIWRGNAWQPEEILARVAASTPTGR